MSNDSQLAVQTPVRASDQLASFLGIEKSMMLDTLKAQCFKGLRPEQVSDAQLAAFVSTANALQVNPLLPGFLYAYPERNGGITPILGPDGVLKKLDEFITTGKLEGYECVVYPEDVTLKPTHATATIYRKDAKPAVYTAIFAEWVITNSPTWNSKPRHMLWIRAIKQAARQVIHGLPMDSDEYQFSKAQDVTGTADEASASDTGFVKDVATPERPAPKPRATKGAAGAKAAEVVIEQEPTTSDAEKAKLEADLKAREAKVTAPEKSQGGDANSANGNPANQGQKPGPVTPQVPSNPAPAATQPRAFINEGEKLTVTAKVESLQAVKANIGGKACAAVKAVLSGGFVGEVRQKEGGAQFINPGKPEESVVAVAPWQVGAVLKFTLLGEKSATAGRVVAWVQSVAPIGAEVENMD